MNKNKILTILVILLALGLSVETIYLLSAKHKPANKPEHHQRKEGGEPIRTSSWKQVDPVPSPFDQPLDSWDPFEEMERMQARINRMFRESLGRSMMTQPTFSPFQRSLFFEPDIDMTETDTHYFIKLDLPGMEKDKINVEVKDHYLTISGERKSEKEEEKEGVFYRMERSFGSFHRMVPLPENANTEGVTADYVNGVMTITVPKLTQPSSVEKQGQKVAVR